jgi:hypothetical protein
MLENTFIYGLVDPRDGQIKYIGKTNNLEKRLKAHLHENGNTLKLNWLKHLKNLGLKPEIIELDIVPMNNWRFWENYWVDLFRSWGFVLKNGDEPGAGTSSWNTESKQKVIDRLKGRVFSDETIQKMKDAQLSKSKEERSEIVKKRKETFDSNPNIEIKRREKLSVSHLGKILSSSHKESISKGMSNSESFKNFIDQRNYKGDKNPNAKGVIFQYSRDKTELIKKWESLIQIQEVLGSENKNVMGNISSCITGKSKSAYGYYWTRENLTIDF